MKVLQINSVCGIGSTGRIATDIHKILIRQGYESYIAYGRDFPKDCDTSIKIGTKYDNYLHVALSRFFNKHGFGSKKATKDLIKKIEAIDPDVIHLHNLHGYYINIELLFDYLKTADKPVIWTLHDCWAFTGQCAYFDYVRCNKWKTQCFDCPQKHSYPASFFMDHSNENFLKKKEIFTGVKNLTLVTPSKWLASLVKDSFLKEYPVRVINNGINLNIFKPVESNFREKCDLINKFILLGVANIWDVRKGYETFLRLSKLLEEDEVILLIGVTEKQKKSMPKNIVGITRTNNCKELAEIYSASNLFINPTLEDNFPTTNLEALACGTPIITFNTGGSPESVANDCGFVIEKGDINELIKKIKSLKSREIIINPSECVRRAKNFFDKDDRYKEYIDLYQEVLF